METQREMEGPRRQHSGIIQLPQSRVLVQAHKARAMLEKTWVGIKSNHGDGYKQAGYKRQRHTHSREQTTLTR